MTKLELIRKKCIEANPSILELKFGCIVKLLEEIEFPEYNFTDTFIFITQNGGGRIADTEDFFDYSIHLNEPVSGEIYKDDCYPEMKIIGRPITLADVLMLIDKSITNERGIRFTQYMINTQGQLAEYGILGKILMTWNLTKTLENQSEETINFLYELLK